MEDVGDLWLGTCQCGAEYLIRDEDLLQTYPLRAEVLTAEREFRADCTNCKGVVDLYKQTVKVVPFKSWMVLPAASDCPDCGVRHDAEDPHDLNTMLYQYRFRSAEAKAGREERWPTWRDAMAHCTPEVQAEWVQALADHGVKVE